MVQYHRDMATTKPYIEQVRERMRAGQEPDVCSWKEVYATLRMSASAGKRLRASPQSIGLPVVELRTGRLASYRDLLMSWEADGTQAR